MDMLFSRKRSMSIAARHKEQSAKTKTDAAQKTTLKKSATTSGLSDKKAGKRKDALDQAFGKNAGAGSSSTQSAGTRRVDEKAPSLTLDIRNSLMLPGLSQRFSVLLPKLSTTPETSLRSLLASQRAREDGPSLTVEEEELLFAEMRDNSGPYSSPPEPWDGSAPSTANAWKSHSTDYLNRSNIPTSASSPSILSQSSGSTVTRDRNMNGSTTSHTASPPPTSSSFTSFRTSGAQQEQGQGTKVKSYGFSGRSQMRDETYLRKVSGKQHGSISSRRTAHSNETSPSDEPVPLRSIPTSEHQKKSDQMLDTGLSDGGATPTANSILDGSKAKRNGSHSASSSTSAIPSSAPPTTQHFPDIVKQKDQRAKRQSHLASLTPAQQKRISKALMEIDFRLRREQASDPFEQDPVVEDEEVLEPEEEDDDHMGNDEQGLDRIRRPSNADSDGSFQSQHSAPFPYGISPARPENNSVPVEPPSPSRLPPSPRSHNLHAQVEGTAEPIPPFSLARKVSLRTQPQEPVLTPIKTQPVKIVPSPATPTLSAVSPVPGYVPGQPRPVGSMHRSDGSVSSRSGTPTGPGASTPNSQNAADTSADALSYLRGHLRAGSTPIHPPPVTSRSSSLARSRSVNQTPESRLDEDSPLKQLAAQTQNSKLLGERPSLSSRRPSSNISSSSPAMIQEESEAELEEDEEDGNDQTPDVRLVSHRREMSGAAQNPQQHMDQARGALGWSSTNSGDNSRIVSVQGSIANTHDPGGSYSRTALERISSEDSLDSVFEQDDGVHDIWDRILGTGPSSSGDEPEAIETPSSAALSDTLRKLSGLGMEDLAVLQERLVQKAKAEREAYRDDSPTISYSPALGSASLPQRSASLARGTTPVPPSSWRRPSHDREVPSTAPLSGAPRSLAGIITPPTTSETTERQRQGQDLEYVSAPDTSKPLNTASTEPPLTSAQTPSAEGHDEMIHTPLSDQLSRNASSANPTNIREGKIALENDPEVRRDFEARIAAATAALNRTPTVTNSKLERKPTKKGVFNISSPKLLSSSSNVQTTPLTPPDSSIDAHTKKALEKTSGSNSKGSGRWRKLGFKSRPSLSSSNEISTPPPTKSATTSPALGLTPTSEKKLEEAISLPHGSPISPDLDNFKFPPLGNKPRNPGIRDRPISPPMPYQPSMQQVAEQVPPSQSGPKSQQGRNISNTSLDAQQVKTGEHSHTSSDSTIAKFIESGRALGLNQEQLDQMLLANGMLDRSATTASSRSNQSTAPTPNSLSNPPHSRNGSQPQVLPQPQAQAQSQPVQVQDQPEVLAQKPSMTPTSESKPKGGIFRALSRRKGKAVQTPSPAVPHSQEPSAAEPRNVVVRRTLLVPHAPVSQTNGPTTPTKNKAGSAFESPDSTRAYGGRKQSIKRKPLNLTREDVALVSNSPPTSAHRRNFSTGTIHSNRSGDVPDSQPGNKGLGFLHPLANSTRSTQGGSQSFAGVHSSPGSQSRISSGSKRRSSTGGSLYDLYGGDDGEEMLRPEPAIEEEDTGPSQAVEICEYADGQVVWSLVNGMRDEEEDDQEYSFSSHSRQDSFTSNASSGQYDSAPSWPTRGGDYTTPALNLRHRERGPPAQRPETFVYRAASGDVADLIDHLSRDLDASRGRIDISHLGLPRDNATGYNTGQSSPFPYSAAQSGDGDDTAHNSPNAQFADPPSPQPPRSTTRPAPPPPIFAPNRTAQVPAGGFSPKRQMMVRQGFAAHRANVSAGGGAAQAKEIGYGQTSPGAESFGSGSSGDGQRTVEERLQNLLDRMKEQNDLQEQALKRRI